MFIVLLDSIGNVSTHTKCASLRNQKCEIQLTLINSHPNEYNQELHYYPFAVKLIKCRVCVPNKTEDLSIHVFNMITGKNESKVLTKDISCECKCRLDGKKCNSYQWWNNDKCLCECKKRHVCEKDYTWNPVTCSCKNGKYLASIMDDSAITCDEIIDANVDAKTKSNGEAKSKDEETQAILSSFNEKI